MLMQLGRFIETFRGSSSPTLAETTKGEKLVIKMRGAGNGASALISEFLVNRLASSCGLPVPDVRIVEIRHDHPWEFGTDEFDDLLQRSFGPNLGICWLPEARQLTGEEAAKLPEAFVSQVVTLDKVFANRDRTAASCNLLRDPRGMNWIVDHGSCRFLFLREFSPASRLAGDHLFHASESTFNPDWLGSLDTARIRDAVSELPDPWLAEEGLDREKIISRIQGILQGMWSGVAS